MLNFSVCVWGGGGAGDFFMFFNAIFSNSGLNTKSFPIRKNIFIDTIFNANNFHSILKVNLCTSRRRTQLQQKFEISVFFVNLS